MSQTSAALDLIKSLRGLIIPLAPFLLTKGYSWVQASRSRKASLALKNKKDGKKDKKVSLENWIVISTLLLTAAISALVYVTLAWPAINVFVATDSRMQTPGDVVGARLKAIYGQDYETAPQSITSNGSIDYELLVSRLASTDGRALYALYGTNAYGSCQWCRTDVPFSFFLYILPTVVLPHLLNFFPILLVTTGGGSLSLSTSTSRQWFTITTICAFLLVTTDVYTLYQAPGLADFMNPIKTSTSLDRVNWVSWSRIRMRGYGFAALDTLLAGIIFMGASGLAFEATKEDEAAAAAVRTDRIVGQLDEAVSRLRAGVLLHTNVIARSKELRDAYSAWGMESERIEGLIRKVPEVIEAREIAKGRVIPGLWQIKANTNVFIEKVFSS